jgi:hypothetical protein
MWMALGPRPLETVREKLGASRSLLVLRTYSDAVTIWFNKTD